MRKLYLLVVLLGFLLINSARASGPLWTMVPVSGFPPAVAVTAVSSATVRYLVTNQSQKPHTLVMNGIKGITPTGCTATLGGKQSCTLSLSVSGANLDGDVVGGPVLCEQGNQLQCYQPGEGDSLKIQLIPTTAPPRTVNPSTDDHGHIDPSTPQLVSIGATITFTAIPNLGYVVNQWLVDGVVMQNGGTTFQLTNSTADHNVSVTFSATPNAILTTSVSDLLMSINCQPSSLCSSVQNLALTGTPRKITIQNTGSVVATNLSVTPSGLPTGTSITSNTCSSSLIPGGTCSVTLTPGSIASPNVSSVACTSGTTPTHGTVAIAADNAPTTNLVSVTLLGYGCMVQGGMLFAVDDTTPNTGSIAGKVISLADQAAPSIGSGAQSTSLVWSSNGTSSSVVDNTSILGVGISSIISLPVPTTPAYPVGTPAFLPCNGHIDGSCNTSNIVSYYTANRASGGSAPTPLTYYAAGLCKQPISGHSDWYLPSICELDGANLLASCPAGIQSVLESIPALIGNPNAGTPSSSCTLGSNCLAGKYWSSTEPLLLPGTTAVLENFNSSLGSALTATLKSARSGVRCARALVP